MTDALTALRRAARRYLTAEARNPDAPHLPTLLQTAAAWMQEALRRGATLEDIASAIGAPLDTRTP